MGIDLANPTATNPATIDDNATYDVVLAKPAECAGHLYLPRHDHWMRGDYLKRFIRENGPEVIDAITARPE